MTADLLIRASRAVTGVAREAERPLAIAVAGGQIRAVEPLDDTTLAGRDVLDIGADMVLMPGLVDSHVHVCEPGNTEWEGFATATRAAAAGGITTLVDMPLDSVPTTVSADALSVKRDTAAGQCHIDVAFWGGVVPGNARELRPMARAGVSGFKCFLADSGSPDFPPVTAGQLTAALDALASLDRPLLVHAESAEATAALGDAEGAAGPGSGPGRSYARYLATHPRGLENLAIAQVIEAARVTRGHAHIVHLSSSDAIAMIASAQREGVRVTAETCPHYLTLAAEEIRDGDTTAKCCPPVREASNRELLWGGLRDETISMIVSDHSPCTAEMKAGDTGDFGPAWGGISSLQLGLPLTWTQARSRGFGLEQVAAWMSAAPARLAGLTGKGRLAPGYDADFCVLAPDESFVVDPGQLHHKHATTTPYAGRQLYGVVRATILRGQLVDPGRGYGGRQPGQHGRPGGRLLSRPLAQIRTPDRSSW
ncbi:MAG TPA: allantoinase AllB [Streptosporangiaceae bacterium]|nr:allantoinase AllB [Streptosporangiaceae bacterium]